MSLAAMDVLSRGELDDFVIMTNFVNGWRTERLLQPEKLLMWDILV
jgi:hypothetical protein